MLKQIFLILLFVIFTCYGVEAREFTKHVVIISIDGLMPELLFKTRTPNLNDQWKKGSYTFKAQTIYPSLTLPSNTSMLTGLTFEKHRVDWNCYESSKSIN